MRRTGIAAADEPIVLGDPVLGAAAASALAASGEVDRGTHGFHTWPAGLHPDAAAILLDAVGGRTVCDPFCGGGTVLVEARIRGAAAIGRDVSPIAQRVAAGRCATPSEAILTRTRSAARALTAAARSGQGDPPPDPIAAAVRGWYAPHVIAELETIRRGVAAADAEIRPFLELCFSAILIKTSFRASDTSPRRVRHDRPAGTTAVLFHKKVREYGRLVAALRDLVPPETVAADIGPGDARRLSLRCSADLILTSPPYPSTYDYLPLQHLRTVWLGLPEGQGEIGARRHWRSGASAARRQWIDDTRAWTAAAADALAPGGHLVVVIGDGLTPSGPIDTSAPTEAAAKAAGLASAARSSVGRPDHARSTTRWEHCFIFHKPRRTG